MKRFRATAWLAPLVMGPLLTYAATTQAAPVDPSPFNLDGFIRNITVDGSDALSSGHVNVDGLDVVLPRNLVLSMPATLLTVQQILGPQSNGPAQPLFGGPLPYEAIIDGNRVGNQYIAGHMRIFQQSVNALTGYINFIDYSTGEFRVGGILNDGTTGARVKINDPNGRYGRSSLPDTTSDPRFTSDDQNPTIRATSGYPMCIPRTDPASAPDPLCPQSNRPRDIAGVFLTNFMMDPPSFPGQPKDPTMQAPFEVGDFVTYSGTIQKDAAGEYVSAFQVIGDLGIYTVPKTKPAYLAVDVTLIGVGGPNLAGIETDTRLRVWGFTTDPTQMIRVFAIDVNPCTGLPAPAPVATVPDGGRFLGMVLPRQMAPAGRFRLDIPKNVAMNSLLPPTRQIMVVDDTFTTSDAPVANNLTADQYTVPSDDFIFPEHAEPGTPLVPLNFEAFPFLVNGDGPPNGNAALPNTTQLSPWPGFPTPTPIACP